MGMMPCTVLLIGAFLMAVSGEYIPPGPKYRCPKEKLLLHPCVCDSESDVGITITCENSNLASMSIGLNNLGTFQLPIEKLTISKSHIGRLYGSLLYKLILRTLDIIDTPIEIIEEHTFLGVNETLNELYIYNSSLKEFPKAAFGILGNLTVLNIDGHEMTTLPKDAFLGTDLSGTLLKLRLNNGKLAQLPIEALQPLRKLKILDLHGNQLKDLKRNQFKGLRDTEVLDLSFNNLVKIDGTHLADLTKMGWCNVSHNHIGELTRGAFARNSVLKWLSMSHNKIKKLDTNSFRGMRFLRRLFLSDNLIADVGRGTFASINRIGTIDLARNQLKKIDYQMFHQLNFIEVIDVSENNVTEIQKLSFKDIYFATINLSRNAINKIEAGSFVNCANVTLLDLSFNQIENIPKRAFDETTYPTELNLAYNKLTELNQIPLHNMTGIRILNVSHNQITKVPRHTFPKLYELHTIDLSHNQLFDIYNSVFQTLFSLRTLDVSHNNLSTIKPSAFGSLPTLLELNLSNNGIKDMAKSALTRLASMRDLILRDNHLSSMFILPISVGRLDLSGNEFEELPEQLWPSMNSLLSLDMSRNRLKDSLRKGSFLGLLTLQKLDLSYNGMGEVPWAALNDLSSLQYIYLEGNNLTTLRKGAFGRLPVVFEVNLAHNKLNNISALAFNGLLQLIVLNMTNNNLSYIPSEAFKGLVALRTLDLSFNRIERIDNRTNSLLEDCLSLETINLSHNRISFISRKTFPSNQYIPYRLKNIDLSYNAMPLVTYDLVFGTGKVEYLNLSHNNIADLRRGAIGNITQLRILDLSYNKLEDIVGEGELFRLPKHVSEVYLQENYLNRLPWTYLHNVTKLEVLDISNNQFEMFDSNMTDMVMNGSKVYFEGNPLTCDCFVRPLRRYMTNQIELDPIYKSIKCWGPPYLADESLHEVPEERLNCPSNINTTLLMERDPGEYDITPDFRFREMKIKDNKIRVKWLVVKNEDIGDPYVVVQNVKDPQRVLYEATLPYFKRTVEIDAARDFPRETKGAEGEKMDYSGYQLCVLAKDSKTYVRKLYREQCKELPTTLSKGTTRQESSVILVVGAMTFLWVTLN